MNDRRRGRVVVQDTTPDDHTARRLLFVHAHPDDETLTTGLTMAHYVRLGAAVTLVTCTLGEEGEVIPPHLRHHISSADDSLGPYRAGELTEAMRRLGVNDHRILGGGRWRDSGMAWVDAGVAAGPLSDLDQVHPDAFIRAPLDVAASLLAEVIRETRPQVVVTYDPEGGYGHPDHIMAHRVTMRAVLMAAEDGDLPAWPGASVHWVQVAESWAQAERRATLASADDGQLPVGMMPPSVSAGFPPIVVPDSSLDVVIEAPDLLPDLTAALSAHETQVRVEPPWFALSNDIARRISVREGFRRVAGPPVGLPGDVAGDLFAGLDITPRPAS